MSGSSSFAGHTVASALYGSVEATLSLFAVGLLGAMLARLGYLDDAFKKRLNELLLLVFLPCLIYVNVSALNLSQMVAASSLTVFALLHTAIGALLGLLLCFVAGIAPELRLLTVVASAFGNSGNLPMAIVNAATSSAPFAPGTEVAAVSYSSLYYSVRSALMWAIVSFFARTPEPPPPIREAAAAGYAEAKAPGGSLTSSEDEEDDDEAALEVQAELGRSGHERLKTPGAVRKSASRPAIDAASVHSSSPRGRRIERQGATAAEGRGLLQSGGDPEVQDDDVEQGSNAAAATATASASSGHDGGDDGSGGGDAETAVGWRQRAAASWQTAAEWGQRRVVRPAAPYFRRVWESRAVKVVRQVMTPPIWALIVGLVVAIIETLQDVVRESDAPLRFLTDSADLLGGMAAPTILLLLGANLSRGPQSAGVERRVIAGVTGLRLVAMPVVGVAMVVLARAVAPRFVPPDDLALQFVLMVNAGMPTAVNVLAVITMLPAYQGNAEAAEKETAALLFFQYLAAVVGISGAVLVYILVLF